MYRSLQLSFSTPERALLFPGEPSSVSAEACVRTLLEEDVSGFYPIASLASEQEVMMDYLGFCT